MIQQEATRISHLVNRVEDFTANATPASPRLISMTRWNGRFWRPRLGLPAMLRLSKSLIRPCQRRRGDAGQLLQVIQNLLKNAAEALPAKGGGYPRKNLVLLGDKVRLWGRGDGFAVAN